MQLTPEMFAGMSEKELRQGVLLPLFEAMGFRDVAEYHGGPQEQGKDIIMWKMGDLGVRENYAVVAKADRISGQVSGSSSAGEVQMQIAQCLGDPYTDPRTGDEREIHRVWVVTTGDIKKEAHKSITNALRSDSRNVRFVDGDRLWKLIEDHLSLSAVSHHLEEVRETLSDIHPDYKVATQTSGKRTSYSLEPRDPDADIEDLPEMQTTFAFPDTPEGRAAREALQDHIERGTEVTIGHEFISEIEIPDPIRRLLPMDKEGYELQLGPIPSTEVLTVKLIFEPDGREGLSLEPVELRRVRVGAKEIELSNEHQKVPCNLSLVLEKESGRQHVRFSASGANANVFAILRAMKFTRALSSGGNLEIIDMDSGLSLFNFRVEEGVVSNPPPDHWIDFLETLVFIQNATGVRLSVPDRDIPGEEAEAILRVASIIDKGQEPLGTGTVIVELDKQGAANMLEAASEESRPQLTLKGVSSAVIFGEKIELGERVIQGRAANFEPSYSQELEGRIENMADDESIEIKIQLDDESGATAVYPKWQ